jgi:ribulose bisphosphate carboxylase small subunit
VKSFEALIGLAELRRYCSGIETDATTRFRCCVLHPLESAAPVHPGEYAGVVGCKWTDARHKLHFVVYKPMYKENLRDSQPVAERWFSDYLR